MYLVHKLAELGYTTVSEDFYNKIREWKSWYQGDVRGFHMYKIRNGHDVVRCKRYSLGMAKKVSEDWSNLLMNERVAITLDGKKENEFVHKILDESNFEVKANEMQELAFALGTVAMIPRVTGMKISDSGPVYGSASNIVIDYVAAEHIWPLTWHNSVITECAFDSLLTINGDEYCYVQIHKKVNGLYDIENRVYTYKNEVVGEEVNLADVSGFELIPPVVHTGSDKRQFVIDKPNIVNNYDYSCPMGIAVFANSIDVLKGVDVAYDSYVNEFQLGKKRIMVKPQAANYMDGEPVFDSSDVVFYMLPEDVSDEAVIIPIDMTLRTDEHNRGIQDQLNLLSSKCGLGETYYRFETGTITTATQVVSENSTMFRTIKRHEIVLKNVLTELCRIILRLGNTAMNLGLNEEADVLIDFDDSIIEDESTNFARDMQLLNAGIMNAWEFRMRWMNENEETAKASLPGMEELTTEEEDEIE